MASKVVRSLSSLPAQVIFVVIAGVCLPSLLPEGVSQFFLALSLTLKEVLLVFLPILIFAFLFLALGTMQSGVFLFVLFLLGAVCLSNFCSVMTAYAGAELLFHGLGLKLEFHQEVSHTLKPLWDLHIPRWISNDVALFIGLVVSLVVPRVASKKWTHTLTRFCKAFSKWFLNRFFIPLVPLFILGFIVKLQYEDVLYEIVFQYGPLIGAIIVLQMTYVLALYLIAAGGRPKVWRRYLRNMLPAYVTGFSSMSSAVALPMTLASTLKNSKEDPLVDAIVPATVNINLIGDSIGVPLLAIGLMVTFQGTFPTLMDYLGFAGYFVLVKFAVAAVPGGGVLVIVPVLEHYFHFSPEMTGLLTAIYILSDSVNTGANVLGNGAFALIVQKTWRRWKPRKAS